MDISAGISYYLNKIVRCYLRVVDDNFVFRQVSAPVHIAFNSVQLLQCKLSTSFFLIYGSVMACLHGAIVAAIGRATDRRDDRLV